MKKQFCRLAALVLFTLLLTSCGTHEKVSENISENIFDNMPENTQEELTGEEPKTEDAGFTGVEEKKQRGKQSGE